MINIQHEFFWYQCTHSETQFDVVWYSLIFNTHDNDANEFNQRVWEKEMKLHTQTEFLDKKVAI